MINQEKSFVAMCKFLLWLLTSLIITFVGLSNVFAITYNNIGDVSNISVFLVSTDYSSSPFNVPKGSAYAFDEVTAIDIQVNNYNFSANTHYQLEIYLTRQFLTNANSYSVSGLNGESCLVSYDSDKTNFGGSYPRWAFQCPHATNSVTIHLYNSANNYLWSGSNVFTWNYTYLKSSSDSITSSSSNDTQNIIDNQNQNTQDIINNQNQNTQDIIDSNKVCNFYDKSSASSSGVISSDGSITSTSSTSLGVTGYIPISSSAEITILQVISQSLLIGFYDINKTFISYVDPYSLTANSKITIPKNASFVRFSINKVMNKPQYEICQNGNKALDDTLKDDDIGDSTQQAADFITDFDTDTFGLTSIITAPLNLIQSLTSSTCTALHLPLPYLNNKFLDLPCMTTIYQTHFGAFFTMYQTITYGIIAYWVIVRIFNQVKDFKNPEHDEIEVVDL